MPAGFPFKNKYPQIYIYIEKFRYIDIRTYGYSLLATAKVMRSGVLGGHSLTFRGAACFPGLKAQVVQIREAAGEQDQGQGPLRSQRCSVWCRKAVNRSGEKKRPRPPRCPLLR